MSSTPLFVLNSPQPRPGHWGAKFAGAQDAAVRVQIGLQLITHPGVVPERDHIRTGGEEIVRLPGRHADDVGVLPVHDAEIDVLLGLERLEPLG